MALRIRPSRVRDATRAAAAILLGLLLASGPPLPTAGAMDVVIPADPFPAASFSVPAYPVLLSRVYAHAARDNEFVEVANLGFEPLDLASWSLTDREAAATFPLDSILPAGGRLLVTRNSTSYAEDVLSPADFTFDRGDARRMEGGVLRLADEGDEVLLLDPDGAIADAYAYGDSSYQGMGWSGPPARAMGRGQIAVRTTDERGLPRDRDAAEDWEGLRAFRLGQSSFDPPPIDSVASLGAVLSPDAGDATILSFLRSARTSIEMGAYTLTSDRIAGILADAARRGVHVRVFLEGAPVGGVTDEERRLVGGLLKAGAEVRWLRGDGDAVKRYRFLHAKYAIVDAAKAWVGSENFGPAGFPPDGRAGNRGWSAVSEEPGVAGLLRRVFEADFDPRRRDSLPADGPQVDLAVPTDIPPWSSPAPPTLRRIQLVVGPDTALAPDGILGWIASARDRLWIQAFYMEETWAGWDNPFLAATLEAARRGVAVRLLLDGGRWSAAEGADDNDDLAARLTDLARREGLDLEARLLSPDGRIERLHNKGLLIDGRAVLVSSLNWARGSATENREVGLLLDDPILAGIFERAFLDDWEGRAAAPDAPAVADPLLVGLVYAFIAVASALSLRKLRREEEGIKPGGRVERRGPLRDDLRRGHRKVRVLSAELVAQPRPRARGRRRARGRGEAPRGRIRGPEGD